jgi:hypothetical protein
MCEYTKRLTQIGTSRSESRTGGKRFAISIAFLAQLTEYLFRRKQPAITKSDPSIDVFRIDFGRQSPLRSRHLIDDAFVIEPLIRARE